MAMTPFQLFLQKEKSRRTNQERKRATFNEQQIMLKEFHHIRTARQSSINETNQRLTMTNFIGSRNKLQAMRSKSNSLTKRNKSVIGRFNTSRQANQQVFITSPSGVVRRWGDTSHQKQYRHEQYQTHRVGSLSPSCKRVKSQRDQMNLTIKGVHKKGVCIQDVEYCNEYNKLLKMYGLRFNKRAEERVRPLVKHKKIQLFKRDPAAITPWEEGIQQY